MNSECKFFESISKRWAYCAEKDEYELKEEMEEGLCKNCPNQPKEIIVIQ